MMSSSMFNAYVCVLLFLMVIEKIDSQECGQSSYEVSSDSPGVITGQGTAKEGEWPWAAVIKKKVRATSRYTPWCSGFLIDTRHLISAAQCYDEKDVEQYRVRIGHINQDEGDEYRISRIVVHSDSTKNLFYNDIAILTLDREVKSENFNPVCLPDEEVRTMNLTGKSTTEIGWGHGGPGSFEVDAYLKYLTGQVIISNQQCQEMFRKKLSSSFQRMFPQGINKDILCALFSEGGHEICIFSGSPLMIKNRNRWFAVGVVSFGISCGLANTPYGYTNISNYVDWIKENINENVVTEKSIIPQK